MANTDIANNIIEAIDIIVKNAIQKVSFDETILCVIEDNSNKDKGEYLVSHGGMVFPAYSENDTYRKGVSVYVTIPQGDYNQQKIITGKYVAGDSESFTWVSPMQSYIALSGELMPEGKLTETSILANGSTTKKLIYSWDNSIKKSQKPTTGFERLGFSADFKTELKQFNTISGTYGLTAEIVTSEPTTSQGENYLSAHTVHLFSEDMWGDPYNFEGYFTQEKVFDITGLGQIISISLYLEQKNNFINTEEQHIPSVYEDSISGESIELPDNIFIDNISITAGYALEKLKDDAAFLYTDNSMTYNAAPKAIIENNNKEVCLRWAHNLGNKFICISSDDDVENYFDSESGKEVKIHWYHKVLKNGISNELAGDFWEEVNIVKENTDNTNFKYTVEPIVELPTEKYKVIIEILNPAAIQEAEEAYNNTVAAIEENTEYDDKEKEIKKIAAEKERLAAINENTKYIKSDEIEFTNESNTEQQNVDLIQALQLKYPDNDIYQGIYRIYDGSTKKVLTPRESRTNRIIEATYKSLVTGESFIDGDGAESITWKIPLHRTMIQKPVVDVAFVEGEDVSEKDGYFRITRTVEPAKNEDGTPAAGAKNPELIYRIKDYYSPDYNNNTIYCEVVKNNLTYTASITPIFGPSGTMGTDYTIDLRITDEVSFDGETGEEIIEKHAVAAVPSNLADGHWVKIEAQLYDHENKPIEKSEFKWGWFNRKAAGDWQRTEGSAFKFKDDNNTSSVAYIRWNDTTVENGVETKKTNFNYVSTENILEISTEVKESIKYTLKAYLPIPSKSNAEIEYLEGATTIMYNSAGSSPEWYKKPYVLYHNKKLNDKQRIVMKVKPEYNVTPIGWSKTFSQENFGIEYSFRPSADINNTNTIKPSPMYIEGIHTIYWIVMELETTEAGVTTSEALWYQPLYIGQNLYESSLLNAWDGNLTIDENNGTILSTMIGAGKKNSNNTFSGVLLGDVGNTIGINKTGIGLYGFHEGAQSFGLNVDGTAFFGKSGKGRINLNGNKATLESSDYELSEEGSLKKGMIIDLDDCFIKAPNWEIKSNGEAYFTDITSLKTQGVGANQEGSDGISYSNNSLRIIGDIYAKNGYFNGEIQAQSGKIGGWTINSDSLSGSGAISGGTISGSTISGSTISGGSIDGTTISAKGYVNCSGLKVGGVEYGMKSWHDTIKIPLSYETKYPAKPGSYTVKVTVNVPGIGECDGSGTLWINQLDDEGVTFVTAWQHIKEMTFLGKMVDG